MACLFRELSKISFAFERSCSPRTTRKDSVDTASRSSTLATFLVVTYYVLDDIVVTYIFDHIIVTCYVFDHIIVIFLIILSTGEMNTLTTQCNAVTTQR